MRHVAGLLGCRKRQVCAACAGRRLALLDAATLDGALAITATIPLFAISGAMARAPLSASARSHPLGKVLTQSRACTSLPVLEVPIRRAPVGKCASTGFLITCPKMHIRCIDRPAAAPRGVPSLLVLLSPISPPSILLLSSLPLTLLWKYARARDAAAFQMSRQGRLAAHRQGLAGEKVP